MLKQFAVKTGSRCQMIDITGQVRAILRESEYQSGTCQVYVPHTTAGVTINENADPDVPRDILATLERLVPLHGNYRHSEGNSDAHMKASLMGFSQTVFFENGALILGTWQSLFFCEFDGPRTRSVFVKLISSD
ncbi:MAG: YjbQ family protein [Syntrophaceae bacterium]|nr:YjbQ family protein [Syntrophaceae bacterium]